VAEMAIGGRIGVEVHTLPHVDQVTALFSESTGRLLCEISPTDLEWFVDAMDGDALLIGTASTDPVVRLPGVELSLDAVVDAFAGVRP
jgi:phosphoribosylformylglycinamidine (FGAM) synthase-like enzyme